MSKNEKYLLFSILASLAMILLPERLSSGLVIVNDAVIIAGYILLISSGILTGLLIYKRFAAYRVIKKASQGDPIWDEEKLKVHTRSILYKLQYCLDKGDADELKGLLTPEFLHSFEKTINSVKVTQPGIVVDAIDVNETYIISCKNYLQNDKDRYAAYIKGTYTEAAVYYSQGQRIRDYGLPEKQFEEIYHFVRKENDWLLDKINARVNVFNLLFSTSVNKS
jgi:predicted lipid-binding transport protein (Tim44 family)